MTCRRAGLLALALALAMAMLGVVGKGLPSSQGAAQHGLALLDTAIVAPDPGGAPRGQSEGRGDGADGRLPDAELSAPARNQDAAPRPPRHSMVLARLPIDARARAPPVPA